MLVEAREKTKSMLTRQPVLDGRYSLISALMAAGALPVVGDRNAARLAAGELAALEDHHLKAALSQFVGGAHTSHAAAQNDDPSHRRTDRTRQCCRYQRAWSPLPAPFAWLVRQVC
jgi:hypothetical protein